METGGVKRVSMRSCWAAMRARMPALRPSVSLQQSTGAYQARSAPPPVVVHPAGNPGAAAAATAAGLELAPGGAAEYTRGGVHSDGVGDVDVAHRLQGKGPQTLPAIY